MKIVNYTTQQCQFSTMHTVKIYPGIALTHADSEIERNQIRTLIHWLQTSFENAVVTLWAFDLTTWTPIQVPDVAEHDLSLISKADLTIFFYLKSAGSDGRGGETRMAVEWKKQTLAFKAPGVGISKFAVDDLAKIGVSIQEFQTLEDMRQAIQAAISGILSEKKCAGEQLRLI